MNWIACKDKMPEYGETVLAYQANEDMEIVMAELWGDEYWRWYSYEDRSTNKSSRNWFTHWQPLPAPPSQEK